MGYVRIAQHFGLDYFGAYDRLTLREWGWLAETKEADDRAAKLRYDQLQGARNRRA